MNKFKLFWRNVRECLRRCVTPYLMYLVCGMLGLASLNFSSQLVQYILVGACIVLAVIFNADLAMNYGKTHYKMLETGNIRRRNEMAIYDNKDRKSYRYEMEYHPVKGFCIGLCICIPTLLISLIYFVFSADPTNTVGKFFLILFCGWAIIPLEWINPSISIYWTLACCLLPILVTGLFYNIGALKERREEMERAARMESVKRGQKPVSNREKKRRERVNRTFK